MQELSGVKKDPFELKYMTGLRFSLTTVGLWPSDLFESPSRYTRLLSVYQYILIAFIIMLEISASLYLKVNYATISFMDVGSCITNILLTLIFMQRLTLPFMKKFKDVLKKYVTEFHLIHHENKGGNAAKEIKRTHKLCLIARGVLQLQVIGGLLTYNMFPLIENIQAGMLSENRPENKTFVHAVDYLVPFDCRTDPTGYWIMFALTFLPSYFVPGGIGYCDLLIFTMLFHISGHINILSYNLKSFPRQSGNPNKPSSQEYNDQVFILLKGVIRHYQSIKEFMAEMSDTFDMTLCGYLVFQQVECCLLLLEISALDRDAIGKYGVLTLFVFQQLIQTSIIFELIHSKTDKLGDKVYALPWEDMNVKNRKTVLIFLRDVQTPFSLKAGGMVPVGVLTMSTILRTSFSYYLMLKTLA